MKGESSEKRGGDSLEEETQSKKICGESTLTPTSLPDLKFQIPTPNWGDSPSTLGLSLAKLALDKFNQDWAQLVDAKPDTYAWVQFSFVGGLNINSFVDEGIWVHLNLEAQKVGVIDPVEDHGRYMFFAELKRSHDKSEYEVKSVCNFGPSKYVYRARLGGCKACDRAIHRDVMMHPMRGFHVGRPRSM